MNALSRWYGALLDALMLLAAVLVLVMAVMIGADVLLRNVGAGAVSWSNEVSEYILYLVTLLSAPWLLRQGQHIRVDIVLRALPARMAYAMEWIADVIGLACALYFVWYGWRIMAASHLSGAISLKTLVLPEWWMLAPLPAAFVLVAIEFVFRMHRLAGAKAGPRDEAVSAA
jgi:TRAP-type transport system small permease protein